MIIGQNNSLKGDEESPNQLGKNTGWLSTNMAQLMVFLNGLILTITAFAILNVFINEIVREELLETTESVQESIFDEYRKSEKILAALSVLLGQTTSFENDYIQDYINKEVSASAFFDSVFVINDENNPVKENISKLYQSDRSLFDDGRIIDFLQKQDYESQFLNEGRVVLYFAFNDNKQSIESIPVAMVQRQISPNRDPFLVVGVIKYDNFVRDQLLSNESLVETIKVTDTDSGEPLFLYQKNLQEGADQFSKYLDVANQKVANKIISIEVGLAIGSRESFLQKIPLLMLVFGVTLTLIGTLYVRNNQMQSKKLAHMNKELAHKNFELNQEINERERLNKVIQKSAREHQSIINSVNDIIFELNQEGKIIFLNDAWLDVTGFELDRSISRNIFDLIYVQDQEELQKSFQDLLNGKIQSYRMFTRLRSSDGKFRAVELSLSMVRKTEESTIHIVGTMTDVEERRRAEMALSEAEKKYRTIVENAAGGIYQVTPEGQFLSANPALARILGYDSIEEILRDVHDASMQVYVDREKRKKVLKNIASLNVPKFHEVLVKKKDGTEFWVNEHIRPVFDEEQNLLYYEGSIEDVDQRKKAELALKSAMTESDLANRSKSEFLANMSHELRTPLNAIIGFSDIIRTEAFGKIVQPEYTDYATNIYESGNHLLRVINEILDVSRIEAGERTLNESVVNIMDSVKSCLSLMEGKIKSSQIRIENRVSDDSLGLIGENQAIKQMLINLLSNAIKFSPENSYVMIDAETDSENKLRLSITDTGIGMSDEELEKALSPFGQIDTEHSRSKSGTGLGLTLVKSLIELHGGDLDIVSQKGIGTTATLIFPAKRVTNKKAGSKIDTGVQSEEVENT
ncbi:MAG: PAS domain-containing sensor histidine kinase [Pseudomonadota bacterium]